MKANKNVRRNLSNPQDPTDQQIGVELEAMNINTGLDILMEKAKSGDDDALKELRETAIRLEACSRALNQLPDPLPDPPLSCRDVPNNPPEISQGEIVSYLDAQHAYRIARADFEAKHGALVVKLLLGSTPEQGSYDVRLDKDCRIISTDSCSSGPPEVTRS